MENSPSIFRVRNSLFPNWWERSLSINTIEMTKKLPEAMSVTFNSIMVELKPIVIAQHFVVSCCSGSDIDDHKRFLLHAQDFHPWG